MKAFADEKFDIAKIIFSPFDRVENIMGNEENAGYQCWPKGYNLGTLGRGPSDKATCKIW